MGKLSTLKQNTAGTIASLQTVLERYPVLITTDEDLGKTSFSFMLNLLKMFGVTEESLIEWLSNLLADKKDGADGLLSVIEAAVKVLIITTFKETYTCSIDPVLPDDIMISIDRLNNPIIYGNGIDIKLEDIDNFGQLSYCPTDKGNLGEYFYFDNSGYTPLTIYSSCDFNAFLWFVINKGNFWGNYEDKRKCMWDNRVYYYKKFEKEGCLSGEAVLSQGNSKYKFFAEGIPGSSLKMIEDVGPKMEILACEFKEQSDGNVLNIHLNADRYAPTIKNLIKARNKTNFEFITDYVSSLKLFDSKTLLAQTINALLGITANVNLEFSLERNVLAKQIRNIVKQVIEENDTEEINDCYYSFSNETYDSMMEEAMNEYNGEYTSDEGESEESKIDVDELYNELYKVESSDNLNEETSAISDTIVYVVSKLSANNKYTKNIQLEFGYNKTIIEDFITEIVTQLTLQVLSPKVMLLYAINEKIMNPEKVTSNGILEFFKQFPNLIVSIIKRIMNIIVEMLWEFLVGQIKPIITLFIQKLLLETIYYYKILIEQLIATCTISLTNTNNSPLVIDNVIGADIIPSKEEPTSEEGCGGI